MGYRLISAADATWSPSIFKGMSHDIAGSLELTTLSARFWRLTPGQANSRHRQRDERELYVLLEGTGRIRVGEELLTLEPMSALVVDAHTVRQVFNDTGGEQLWLIVGTPRDKLTPEDAEWVYPDGREAMPPELAGA